MKTQNAKLVFKKNNVTELNDNQLNDVNGGGTPVTVTYGIYLTVAIFILGGVKGCADEVANDDGCNEE